MKLRDLINALDTSNIALYCSLGNCGNRLVYTGELNRLPWGYAKFTVKNVFIEADNRLGVILAEEIPLDYLD